MNDRQTDYLGDGAEKTLQRAKDSKGRPVVGERGAQDHEHGDDLWPDPDGESRCKGKLAGCFSVDL